MIEFIDNLANKNNIDLQFCTNLLDKLLFKFF